MDFGIARMAGTEHLTTDGFMMGTPAYMAPEQVLGGEIDGRADLYAMGVVFYRLLTAHLPFKADSGIAMVQKQINDPPTPVRQFRAELPPMCQEILTRALAKAPEHRFQTAEEFRAALAVLSGLGSADVTSTRRGSGRSPRRSGTDAAADAGAGADAGPARAGDAGPGRSRASDGAAIACRGTAVTFAYPGRGRHRPSPPGRRGDGRHAGLACERRPAGARKRPGQLVRRHAADVAGAAPGRRAVAGPGRAGRTTTAAPTPAASTKPAPAAAAPPPAVVRSGTQGRLFRRAPRRRRPASLPPQPRACRS